MSQKDKDLARLLMRLTYIFLDLMWLFLIIAICTYSIKTTFGIDLFPNWSLFH
jgi:hypothetical protein